MLAEPFTVAGRMANPYLHLDNRGLVVFDGDRGVVFAGAMLGWVRETVDLLIEERRATRHRSENYLGGWIHEDGTSATVYAGPGDHLVSLDVSVDALRALRERLGG